MKRFYSLSALALLLTSTAIAQSFDQTAAQFTWPIGNEAEATVNDEAAPALLESKVTVGTDLTVTTYDATSNGGGTLACYQPGTSNPGCVETDMIEYTVRLRKGITMTVSNVLFDAVKQGTDGAYFSWSYTADGTESDITAYSDPKTQILRNNNANPEAPLTHDEAIASEACRTFTLRFYISNTANNKKMAIGNIRINASLSGSEEQRDFQPLSIDFRTDPYQVLAPATGLPEGVTVTGSFHDSQHGYSNAVVTVPVDGPVRFVVGGCSYSNQATVKDADGTLLATLDTRSAGCDDATSTTHSVAWTYNSETPTTLTLSLSSYCPFLQAEACELIPYRTVRYYDVDGSTILGEETVEGGSALVYAYGATDVTVAEGMKFRGWFNSTQSSAVKVAEGTSVQEDLNLYAKATEIEIPTSTSRYIYELNKANFYIEDHEAIWNNGGSFHDTQHGWSFSSGQSLSLAVAGKCLVTIGNCKYSAADVNATVTNAAGETVASFPVQAETDGAEYTFQYAGTAADTLTLTFGGTTYVHKVTVYNVKDFVQYDQETGYYQIPADDANSFLIALASANATGNAKIFLPNGTYDLGQLCLTSVSGKNISIIGESMENTIIVNAPLVENEGIGTTATLLNTSDGLYLQDLTLQNALDYYASGSAGRAVCLQDKGKNTICKNVRMLSYQDTYYSNAASDRYWEDSEIHGTVDYLCGDGNVVYNRVALVNESRSAGSESGSDVISAPYCTATTSSRRNWGYVFLDCTVRSESKDFTFARSWGGESMAVYIRTQVLDNSLNASRWTIAGMNCAASCFKEYQTMDSEGNNTTPDSNVLTFTHNSGNNTFETVLTDEEAAEYTVQNIFGEWAPDQICAQVEIPSQEEILSSSECFLVNGTLDSQYEVRIASRAQLAEALETLAQGAPEGLDLYVRAANGRGGFGPSFRIDVPTVGIEQVQAAPATASQTVYNLFGQPAAATSRGILVIDGQKALLR